jgi:hypothetical protein
MTLSAHNAILKKMMENQNKPFMPHFDLKTRRVERNVLHWILKIFLDDGRNTWML